MRYFNKNKLYKKPINIVFIERRKKMTSFSDYMKEIAESNMTSQEQLDKIQKTIQESKDNLVTQISGLRDNLNLRIEELKCMKDALSDYDYLYIMVKLKVAKEHLTDAIDILNGWYPEDEENIPADMVFEEGDPDEQDRW